MFSKKSSTILLGAQDTWFGDFNGEISLVMLKHTGVTFAKTFPE